MEKKTPGLLAIETLIGYTHSLEKVTDTKSGTVWKAGVKDSIIKYLGPNSSFIKVLDEMFFTEASYQERTHHSDDNWLGRTTKGIVKIHTYKDGKKQDFVKLLQQVMEYINTHGLYSEKVKHNNELGRFSNKTIIGWAAGLFVAIILTTHFISTSIANNAQDKESSEKITDLKNRVHDLELEIKDEMKRSENARMESQDYRLKSEEWSYKYDSLLHSQPKNKGKGH